MQARKWGVCTMNEFREFLGLKRFDSFEEWSTAPGVAAAARQLYGHIDNLELYPGLQAEDCMPLGPGSGICCGYTMTRAILADAINLVRGDRFFTTDYTPESLTSWGFQDCVRDPDNGAFGAALPKLLFRHLPRHYPPNSVYALFPFFTPAATRDNLTKLGLADKYAFDRPVTQPVPKVLNTLTGIRHVFADPSKFVQIYTDDMKALTRGYGFMLVFDQPAKHDKDRAFCWHALVPDMNTMNGYTKWYKDMTEQLIAEKQFKYDGVDGTYVDIIRDVVNLVSVHWAADKLVGLYQFECISLLTLLPVRHLAENESEPTWGLYRAGSIQHVHCPFHVCFRERRTRARLDAPLSCCQGRRRHQQSHSTKH